MRKIVYVIVRSCSGNGGLTSAILFASGAGVAAFERWLTKSIAIDCCLSIALLLLLCGHRETFALVVIAPVYVVLNDPLDRADPPSGINRRPEWRPRAHGHTGQEREPLTPLFGSRQDNSHFDLLRT